MTTLCLVSALVLGAWFVMLHSLWNGASQAASAQDTLKPVETLLPQKLSDVTGQQVPGDVPPR